MWQGLVLEALGAVVLTQGMHFALNKIATAPTIYKTPGLGLKPALRAAGIGAVGGVASVGISAGLNVLSQEIDPKPTKTSTEIKAIVRQETNREIHKMEQKIKNIERKQNMRR